MFTHITWESYLVALIILSATWYVTVGLLFYRHKIVAFFSKDSIEKKVSNGATTESQDSQNESVSSVTNRNQIDDLSNTNS